MDCGGGIRIFAFVFVVILKECFIDYVFFMLSSILVFKILLF